jgi:PucR C-terminal helix-turn-helix domain
VRVQVGEFLERPAERLVLSPAGRSAAGASAAPPRPGAAAPPASDSGGGASTEPGAGPHPLRAGPGQPEPPLHELLLASVPVPVLRSLGDRLLGPVRDYDVRHKADLLPTLASFLACDGSWSACASRMYVHVNTVRYRIGRIESLTGRDLSALADRVDFFLALRGA